MYTSGVMFLIGQGNGQLIHSITQSPAGFGEAWDIAAGDFNADGNLDVATAEGSAVGFLGGNGKGSFLPWVYSSTAMPLDIGLTDVKSIAAGDLNNDGIPEIVVAGQTGGAKAVGILSWNGSDGFTTSTHLAGTGFPMDVAIGDFNGDGWRDLVVSTGAGVTVLINDHAGGFTSADFGIAGGTYPTEIAVGDLNNDGKLDIVTANNSLPSDLSILLNDGAGGFTATRVGLAGGWGPWGIAVADLNGDGNLDIATADYISSDVSILFGDGAGGFTGQTILSSPRDKGPGAIAIGEMDAVTGGPDIVIACRDSHAVSVLSNDGSGHFSSPYSSLLRQLSPYYLALGNFDATQATLEDTALFFSRSNHNAIAVSDADAGGGSETVSFTVGHGTLSIGPTLLTVTGNGTSALSITGPISGINNALGGSAGFLRYLPAPDYNGIDFLTILADDLGNAGGATLTATTQLLMSVTPVNDSPVITSDGGGDTATVSVLERTTSVTTVVATDLDSPTLTYSIAGGADAAKFQIDGATGALSFITAPNFDIAADADHNNSYIVRVRASDGSLADEQTITVKVTDNASITSSVHWINSVDMGAHPAGWLPAGIGDFNADGTSDLAWFNAATTDVDIWKLSNGGWAGSSGLGSHPAGYQPAGFGDYTGDGASDVLWFNPATRAVDLWKIPNGQWAGSVDLGTHPAGFRPALTGDFNGDGSSDVAWYNPTTNAIDIWKMSNGQWAGSSDLGSHPAGYVPVLAGDFDGDGTSDVAWYNPTSHGVDIWLMKNGHWAGSTDLGQHPAGWQPLGAADFNLDGTSDIAWYNPATNDTDIWLIKNGQWAGSSGVGAHPAGAAAAGVGDFDHNGVADIMWYDNNTHHTENWLLAFG